MNTIYQPKGKAAEYADWALNLYRGCDHRCTYCYAPMMLKMKREEFDIPKPRPDIIPALQKATAVMEPREVFLCFTCDPYMELDRREELTRLAICILHQEGHSVRILTKGGARSTRDFDLLREGDAYGATLTFIDRMDSLHYEPGAALPAERIGALKEAHAAGIYTWVSLEPVIDAIQTLQIISATYEFVDEYKIGKWNYDARSKTINWKWFGNAAATLCEGYGRKYYIKEDLRKDMEA